MSQIHLKLYNFSELEDEIRYRKEYKTDFTGYFREKLSKLNQKHVEDKVQIMREEAVPDSETEIVMNIIKKF